LTETGKLYSWGSYKEGVLGHGTLIDDYHTPQQIRFLSDSCIIDISAGKAHAGAVVKRQSPVNSKDSEYVLYMWGSNKYGQLGLGDSCKRDIPCEA
jgi:alpha-tubulin suppressor-like RCC1 family protein